MASIETARNYREGGNDRFNAWDNYYGAHFVYAGAGDDIISLLFLSGEQTTVFGDGGKDFLSTFETDEIDTIRVYSVENWSK